MSINFKNDVNDETIKLLKDAFGEPLANDRRTFLFDRLNEIKQPIMKKVANAAKQPATVEIHGHGDIKVLSDGTRYFVTPQGWRKIEE